MIASIGMNDLCRYEFGESFVTFAVRNFRFKSTAISGNKKALRRFLGHRARLSYDGLLDYLVWTSVMIPFEL